MAKRRIINEEITSISQPWGGTDANGQWGYDFARVEDFLKRMFGAKMGCFYYNEESNNYLVFAGEEERDLWIENHAEYADLILGAFDAPFNYNATMRLVRSYVTLMSGETGQTVDFTFEVQDKSGAATGDGVNVVFTISNGGSKQVIRRSYAATSDVISLNVDDYLKAGTNTVIVSITGQTTFAATSQMMTFFVVDLSLTSSFSFTDAVDPSGILAVPFLVGGTGVKNVELFIDGSLVFTETGLSDLSVRRTTRINLSTLTLGGGRHTLQLRAYITSNGINYYSHTLYYDFPVVCEEAFFLFAAELPIGELNTTGSLILSATQYEECLIGWGYYSPTPVEGTVTVENLEGQQEYTFESGEKYQYSYTPTIYGNNMPVTFSYDETTASVVLNIARSNINIEDTIDALLLKLSAAGRSNGEANPETWKYNGVEMASFHGFEWNQQSGWVNGALLVKKGSYVEILAQPFLNLLLSGSGMTIEIDFSTDNVDDENTTVLLCANDNGVGLTLTATGGVLKASSGRQVETKFKPKDRQRLCFVVNSSNENLSENYGLLCIMSEGIIERTVNYALGDTISHDGRIRIGSASADVLIREIRVYGKGLTEEETWQNFAIASPDKLRLVSENNILTNGVVDYEKVSGLMPTFLFTGNMRTILDAKSKSTTESLDVDYKNPQDPTYNFTVKDAYIRPQGTSSLGYPIKNIRLYTNKTNNGKKAVMYDWQGNIIDKGLYSFKEGAQPVNCWTLKADYAESSMSHNTGVARLWNELLKNMTVNGVHVCRTQAQQAAMDAGYEYDVRTAIDGFPCCVFYRESESSQIVFMGQFNFNNDKSTESVFGFRDIPGFDNSNVECWESLNNGEPIDLFQTTEGFYSTVQDEDGNNSPKWATCFESRYPDTSNPNTTHLKAFADWVVSCKNDAEKFRTEKWEHIDVYKMAAYYVYCMRHGAIDQIVKNSMLTTEGFGSYVEVATVVEQGDGTTMTQYATQWTTGSSKRYYYIHYDNDSIHGIDNNSNLVFGPLIDRQSMYNGAYCYAGHESVLWNRLEADAEFMRIVQQVDQALAEEGLTYDGCVNTFDTLQSSCWPARIYNASQKYKYIEQFRNGEQYLHMLQGPRKSHRHWWLKTRFDFFDSKFVSGQYRSHVIQMKVNEQVGYIGSFSLWSGDPLYYGYGINNNIVEMTAGVLALGQSKTFTMQRTLLLGDPVRIFGASHIQKLDVSPFAHLLDLLDLSGAYDGESGTRLRSLIIGHQTNVNNSFDRLSVAVSEGYLTTLEEIGIRNMAGMTQVTGIEHLPNLHVLDAQGSGLVTFAPMEGVILENVTLPATIQILTLVRATLTANALSYSPNSTLRELTVRNCTGEDSKTLVKEWINAIES